MPPLTLVPEAVPLLCQALMAGIAGAFVLSLPRKTRSAWWLAALFTGNLIFALCFMLGTMLISSAAWELRFSMGIYMGVGIAGFAGVRLSYTFLARPFRREARRVNVLAASALALLLSGTFYAQVTLDTHLFEPLLYGYGVFLLAAAGWALAVHIRQSRRFRQLAAERTLRRPERLSAALAHRIMAGMSVLMLVLSTVNALATIDVLPPLAIQYGSLLVEMVIDVGLIVVFINHSPEPTTVQAKLVGVSLGSMLLLLGLTSMALLRPLELAEAAGNTIPEEITLRFMPDESGGYRVERERQATFDVPPPNAEIAETSVQLPFEFPLGGQMYREVSLSPVPYIAFGSPEPCTRTCVGLTRVPDPHHPLALAFVIPSDFDLAALPRVTSTPDMFEAQWTISGLTGQTSQHRAVLWADGSVEIAYRGPERHPRGGSAGLHVGRREEVSSQFAWFTPSRIKAGTALVDPYGARFTDIAGGRTMRMVALVIGATFLVLVLIPLFLRRGVLAPLSDLLRAVERVNRGDRDVRITAHSNDEFGALARRFNGMTGSLAEAERRLIQYAESLEDRVADRTRALRAANTKLGHQRDALEQSVAELRDTQNRLVQAEKQASLGRLTAGIAHELKNPLNFVTNFSDLSAELAEELTTEIQSRPDRPARDLLADIEPILEDLAGNTARIGEHGRRADQIVQAMLLHAPQGPRRRTEADLNALLRLAAEGAIRGYVTQSADGSEPQIDLDLDPSVGTVPVFAEGILQVAATLLDNALYAADHAEEGAAPLVHIRSNRSSGYVDVEVRDHGPGMSAETMDHVFEPFFTTKPPGEGTGLGLSLAYDIVTSGHGGEILVESEPGVGATFTVRLPVTEDIQAPQEQRLHRRHARMPLQEAG